MAKLVLLYEATVLREIPLSKAAVTIGRTVGNDVVIDNLAVSSSHARIYRDDNGFALEDNESLNGTFVNDQRVRKSYLKNGDRVRIGKHTLVFHDEGGAAPPPAVASAGAAAPAAKLELTEVLDTRQQREFLKKATAVAEGGSSPDAVAKVGCLLVTGGRTDQPEYILTGRMTVIGKSAMASVKLKGWFKPDVAAVILKKDKALYQIAPAGRARVRVNGQAISGPHELKEDELIEVAGAKMRFQYRE